MAIVNGSLQIGKKDSTFFSSNPTLILSDGQLIYNETTGDLFIGDGVTALNSLVAINGASGGTWGSITGTLSNQTDLQNALNAKQNTLGYTAEDSSNKTSTVTGNETSIIKYPTIKGMYDWATGLFATIASLTGYVKKGTLTTNYIPKSTASDTIGDSTINYDGSGNLVLGDGSKAVSTNGLYPLYSGFGNSFETGYLGVNNDMGINGNVLFKGSGFTKIYAGASNDLYYYSANKHYFQGTTLNVDVLTASQIVETDASKNLVSAAKGTAYNKNFGTGTTNIVEIGSTLGNSLITSTDANGKLQTLSTTTYPSLTELSYAKGVTSAIQTQLDAKLTSTTDRLLFQTSCATLNPADATTYYMGTNIAVAPTTVVNFNKFQFPNNYTITKVLISARCNTNPSSESVSFYLRENNTTDKTITTSMDMNLIGTNGTRVYVYTGLGLSVSSSADYEIKIVTPTWVTNPTNANFFITIYGY